MYTYRIAGACALALVLAACDQAPSTAPNVTSTTLAPASATAARRETPPPSTKLENSPLTDAAGNVVGTFTGTVTLSHVAVEGGTLVGTLLVNGEAVVRGERVPVTDVAVTTPLYTGAGGATTAAVSAAAAGSCPILDLAIGQIHLNLLGLDVTLSAIDLDIVAQSGPGALLGNLLCAVVHLLDGPTGGALGNALTNLINLINGLLAGL